MPENADFCRALTQSLGADHHLALIRWSNALTIRRATSIPTTGLASRRFESAVLAATPRWFQCGLFSEIYAALLFVDLPSELEDLVKQSLDAYAFEDPWSGIGVTLECDFAVVPLAGVPSCRDAFRVAIDRLGPAGDRQPAGPFWESWCEGEHAE